MSFKKTRNILVAAVAAATAIVPFTPAHAASADVAYKIDGAHVAINPCNAVGVTSGSRIQGELSGVAKASGAVATRAGCGIVQNGEVVAYTQTALPGTVAATASTFNIPVDDYYVCADVYALFVDGTVVQDDNCPR
ncbi:MAG TPA: hypothetical protein VHJ76_01490 [Actinomycetota bacterium]|nr:hypothetical protein [Actinomycetota bacterium]